MTLKDLKTGQSATITSVGGQGALRQHFLDMGVIPGADVTLIKFAPMGDPMELRIHGYELTLRLDDAAQIDIDSIRPADAAIDNVVTERYEHPGFGESGKYHSKANENPLPKDTLLRFALAGNQNCGKTTLFNAITGSNQHVGNFPGITVSSKSGQMREHKNTSITDLPGIYSLSPYTAEEIVSRDFLLKNDLHCIINIVDATNIERNLYLTLQLMELNKPMVLALNMMDEVENNGGTIDVNAMEEMLGIPVVPVAAVRGDGIDELVHHAIHIAKYQEVPGRNDFCGPDYRNGAVHRCIHGIVHIIDDHAADAGIPARFAATKVIENDQLVIDALKLSQNEIETIEHMIITMEEEGGLDRSAAIADMRFSFIQNLCSKCVTRLHESKEHKRSEEIDKILTGRYTAIPVFILIMGITFYLTFGLVGPFLQNLLANGIDKLTIIADNAMTAANVNPGVHSLIIDAIFTGVGSVVSFVPVIVVLFFFLSLMEDSGYIARVAFVMDKLLRKIGLSGRSIVPMLIGFGCTVPGIMATRTLPSARDRKMTVILTPFMSCTAKLPIYGLLTGLFFPKYAGIVTVALYLLGILIGVLTALLAKNTVFKGEAVPFVMELPNYRLPSIKNVALLLWEKAKDFLEKAFSIILVATIVIWFLMTFNFSLDMVSDKQNSMMAAIAGFVAPVFALQGFGDWRIVTALLAGFLAKENFVSSIAVLFGEVSSLASLLTLPSAASLLVFCLLYTPCIASISTARKELGIRWAIFIALFQCAVAWLISFIVCAVMGGLV